jgi:hypothetical protein
VAYAACVPTGKPRTFSFIRLPIFPEPTSLPFTVTITRPCGFGAYPPKLSRAFTYSGFFRGFTGFPLRITSCVSTFSTVTVCAATATLPSCASDPL